MSPDAGMAELFGRIDGSSRGKGGSMHFFDVEHHFYGGHGIVGGQIPVGVGMGFACKYKGTGGVAMAFFGDGAINQGAFHEAANLAALYKVPVLLVVENNAYAMGTSVERSRGDADLSKSGYPYGMTSVVVDGMDLFEVYHAFRTIADEARAENGDRGRKAVLRRGPDVPLPRPLDVGPPEVPHQGGARGQEGRGPDRARQAVPASTTRSPRSPRSTRIDDAVKAEVNASVDFADASPEPPVSSMFEDVYVQDDFPYTV